MLRRLQEQGLLAEEWRVEESRPRKYYVLTEAGRRALRELGAQWRTMVDVMNGLLEGGRG